MLIPRRTSFSFICGEKQKWLLLVSWALLRIVSLTSVVLGDQIASNQTFSIDYEMSLRPFQVLLQYDDSFPMPKSDEMIVLSSTQHYLTTHLQKSEPDFLRITLYQYVRDYVMESREHFSKIAMNGMVFFSSPITEDVKSRIQNDVFTKLSADSDQYVSILHEEGMEHVVNATLLSIQGNEMTYEDGKMIEMSVPEQSKEVSEDLSRDMGDDMRNKVVLLCLLVPGFAILAIATVFLGRMAREINWSYSARNESLWQQKEMSRRDDLGPELSQSTQVNTNTFTVNRRKHTDFENRSDIP
ncbi:hypothetical protein IV203_021006 [Nitzschia inconspicua]|uniref:Uncharacterized protein n=1 Tax=Nitzschia inconspicua TaxID=303405 RepID=A0A9K3PDU5_9STRA|nr:hypothetical protein IV203_021006 [Nitzschia inconspicua]